MEVASNKISSYSITNCCHGYLLASSQSAKIKKNFLFSFLIFDKIVALKSYFIAGLGTKDHFYYLYFTNLVGTLYIEIKFGDRFFLYLKLSEVLYIFLRIYPKYATPPIKFQFLFYFYFLVS